jgi:2-polyprenyl-3-methyl-5-hydroxy-6-metoxy-1,4-benzoquinol methylase
MVLKNKNFKLNNGITDFNIEDPVTSKVKDFYKDDPFPNYKIDDNKYTTVRSGDNNWLMKELKKFVGFNKLLLEAGSGTCQLSNYLAIGTNNQIYAFDSTFQSLKLGKEFAEKNNIQNVSFVRGDIFDKIFKDEVFDFIWCNGVLHHTKNPYGAFKCLLPYLKKNGYIFVGLYNKIGRFRTKFRKYIYKIFGKKILIKFDPVLRSISSNSQDKINSWIKDQYTHPVESTHTFDEILRWFKLCNIEFISSIPECSPFTNAKKSFFEKKSKATFVERIIQQFIMIFTSFGAEGGVFIFIGKK